MESKPSPYSAQDSVFAQENSTETGSIPSEKPSCLATKKKMRYFLKVATCNEDKPIEILRKRRYCLTSLTSENEKEKYFLVNQVLRVQKSKMALSLPNGCFVRRRSQVLQSLRRVEVISDDKMGLVGIRNLTKHLGDVPRRLEQLSLNFRRSDYLDDHAVEQLNRMGDRLRNLKHFSINLSALEGVTGSGVSSVAKYIGNNLKSLQTLNINLSQLLEISEEAFIDFGAYLGNLQSLKSLTLDFSKHELISCTGVRSLAEQICTKLKSLESLSLDFSLNEYFYDDVLISWAEQIQCNLQNLRYLSLNFGWIQWISESGVNTLIEHLQNVKTLQYLYLNFERNENITKKGVRNLAEYVKNNVDSLKDLSFYSQNFDFASISSLLDWYSENLN